MNNTLLIVLGVFLVILLLALIIFAILGAYVLVKKNPELFSKSEQKKSASPIPEEITDQTMTNVPEVLEEHCKRHKEIKASALCSICMEPFCEKCNIHDSESGLNFCTEHHRLYTQSNWVELEQIRTNPDEAEKTEYLYKFKSRYWLSQKIPMIVSTHYQINVERDVIESDIKLLVRDTERERLKSDLEALKNELKAHEKGSLN